jgi:hypothetical protein
MLCFGIANLWLFFRTDALGRAVARLRLRIGTIDFHQHGIVNLIGERRFHGVQIGSVAVAGFVYAKAGNFAKATAAPATAGDLWTWTALCADTKLIGLAEPD